jgi:toxin ParE1/3/4
VARYRLSNVADQKIESIYEYSLLNFGEPQAEAYFLGLHDLFELLADNPMIGRKEPELGDNIRRFPYEAHIVFYRPLADGILILDLRGVRQRPRDVSGRDDR